MQNRKINISYIIENKVSYDGFIKKIPKTINYR